MLQLDDTDIAILEAVQDNARIAMTELAESLGVAASTCQRRLARLEEIGLIERFTAFLDEERLGYDGGVLVQITLESQGETALSEFEAAVGTCPEVVECYLMTGEADYLLRIVVRDMRDFERIHKTHLSRLPHVSRIQSNMALRRIIRRPPPIPRQKPR